jgi:hypothetical protein
VASAVASLAWHKTPANHGACRDQVLASLRWA